jgi:hypothetical protein
MPSRMRRVLVACEYTGRVRDAFTARGWVAVSCDILPSDNPRGLHIRGDVRQHLNSEWDLMIAFPPCTDLSTAGAVHWKKKQATGQQDRALRFVLDLMNAPIPRIAIENPTGLINTRIRKPDQIINPYQFGEPWRKRTCLWLKGLPPLEPTDVVEPRGYWVDGGGARRAAVNGAIFHDVGQVRKNRAHDRSATFQGIADAMAEQWGA